MSCVFVFLILTDMTVTYIPYRAPKSSRHEGNMVYYRRERVGDYLVLSAV